MEFMAPFIERMGAMEGAIARLTANALATPSASGSQATTIPIVPVTTAPAGVMAPGPDSQELWMKTIERYQKLRAPEFQGGFDPLVANKWKEDVSKLLELIRVDPVRS